MTNLKQLHKLASRSQRMLTALTDQINEQREELRVSDYQQTYSKAMVGRPQALARDR